MEESVTFNPILILIGISWPVVSVSVRIHQWSGLKPSLGLGPCFNMGIVNVYQKWSDNVTLKNTFWFTTVLAVMQIVSSLSCWLSSSIFIFSDYWTENSKSGRMCKKSLRSWQQMTRNATAGDILNVHIVCIHSFQYLVELCRCI